MTRASRRTASRSSSRGEQVEESGANEVRPRSTSGSSAFAAQNIQDFGQFKVRSGSDLQQKRTNSGSHALAETGDTMTPHKERMRVLEALDLNQTMQQEIMKQLSWIDDSIVLNLQHLYEVRAMRWKEQRINRSKSFAQRVSGRPPNFFVDEHNEAPALPKTPYNATAWRAYRYRPWTHKERGKLIEAIRTEARRLMALDYHASGHHHLIWEVEKVSDERLEVYSVDRIDWKRVSKIYVPTRTPMECMIQWTTQEHPKINKTPWSVKENQTLMKLVKKYGQYGNWEKIAIALHTDRTVSQCFSHYQSQANRQQAKKKWTKSEDRVLTQAVKQLGPRNWQQVAHMLGDRTGGQCLQRWTKALDPAIRRSRWSAEEDEVLKNAVEVYGLGNWTKVQQHIPGRTDMQCRERWVNILDPALDHSKLNAEELEKLQDLVKEHGPKWSVLVQYFPGRTDNQLLRAWKTLGQQQQQTDRQVSVLLLLRLSDVTSYRINQPQEKVTRLRETITNLNREPNKCRPNF
ncbi:hypothetical protein INT43_005574 [Umbelopsis isabellina]|uniref:Uncharacterized protein n=1 Tax=Mortierella isabellina TaxID=91625 RepID=A0A8H7PMC9_MORIS|nr:hypothetical protein INT43_005574 [Umbelopsis isabellina]